MTPKQLRTALARMDLSQRAAARLLDIDERTMRKYVAGDLVIPEMLVWALRGLASDMTAAERNRDLLRLLGVDPRGLSAADIAEGAEAARRISQCDQVPGAGKRRPQAIADWQAFLQRVGTRKD
jgi:hypothetical protein